MSRPRLAVLFSAYKIFLFRKRLQRQKEMCAWEQKVSTGGGGIMSARSLCNCPSSPREGVTVGCQGKGTEALKW